MREDEAIVSLAASDGDPSRGSASLPAGRRYVRSVLGVQLVTCEVEVEAGVF